MLPRRTPVRRELHRGAAVIQEVPVCFTCEQDIETGAVFEAPCGHPRCGSVVFHGLCLMEWREHRQRIEETIKRWVQEHADPRPPQEEPSDDPRP